MSKRIKRRKVIRVKYDEKTDQNYLDLYDFKDYIDPDKVDRVKFREQEDGSIVLEFLDARGKKLKVKGEDDE